MKIKNLFRKVKENEDVLLIKRVNAFITDEFKNFEGAIDVVAFINVMFVSTTQLAASTLSSLQRLKNNKPPKFVEEVLQVMIDADDKIRVIKERVEKEKEAENGK